jgi:zinc protease
MMRRSHVLFLLGLLLASPVRSLAAQAASAAELATPLPMDSLYTVGTLDNGLRYYIRVNQRPEKRAELRLVVNAGSVLEADDQRGLAHMVEHMAFNGTEHFPKQALVHYLQSIGMRFGADVNAYTSFDETVYMLTVPTDTGRFLEQGIEILGDWAHGQVFDSSEVESERGVVIEEWRLGRGAGARMRDRQLPILLRGSRYAERIPIGDPDYLRTFPHEPLRRFYRDWYRPDLMAVVAVGDFDKAVVERLIRDRFSSLPRPASPPSRTVFPVPPHDSTYVAIATDREATNSSVAVYSLLPVRDQSTVGAYRQDIVEGLFSGMLNARFSEIVQRPDAPFAFAGGGRGYFVRSADAYTSVAGVRSGGVLRGLEAALTETERVARYGFTATELERQKTNVLRGYEQIYAERERRQSASHAAECIRHILQGESMTGAEVEYRLNQRFLPGITLDEVNGLARERLSPRNRVVLVNAPEQQGVSVPTEAQLLAVFDTVRAKTIEPYRDSTSTAPLVAHLPEPAAIVSERRIPEIGVTEWRLANGVRVVLKPTDFQADQILLSASSPGGTSLAADSNYVSASFATTAVSAGGIGEFSAINLRRILTGKIASANPFVGSRTEGMSGSASPRDVETMFQLVYLRFAAPRRDSAAFVAFRQTFQAQLANRGANPQAAFQDTIGVTMSQHHFRARPISAAVLDEIDLDRAMAFYRERYADASDFTFFIVGNFSVDSLRPLVQRYLGGLPSISRHEAGRDVGIRPPAGVVDRVVRRGVEPQSQTFLSFTGTFEWSRVNSYVLRSLGEVLQLRLLDRLREALGGTYSVSANAGGGRDAPQRYGLTIQFGSAPERVEELTRAVFAEIQAISDSGPSAAELERVKETQRRQFETGLRQNAFWLSVLGGAYQYGDDPRIVLTYDTLVSGLTAAAIRDAARRYLRITNYVHVTLLPEAPHP